MSHRSSPRPSSMGRRRIAGWEEQDVHTGWRRIMCTYQRAGQSARAKRRSRRRERRVADRALRTEVQAVLAEWRDDPAEEITNAGRAARLLGRDVALTCGVCKVDALLDAATLDPDCDRHGPVLAALRALRHEVADQ